MLVAPAGIVITGLYPKTDKRTYVLLIDIYTIKRAFLLSLHSERGFQLIRLQLIQMRKTKTTNTILKNKLHRTFQSKLFPFFKDYCHTWTTTNKDKNCSLLGTDNVRGQIFRAYFCAKWRLLFIYHLKANVLRCPRETSLDVKTPDRLCFGDTGF